MDNCIKLTENDIKFVKDMVNYKSRILKCQESIKENYNIDSVFNEDAMTLSLICRNINESLNVVAAKKDIRNEFLEEELEILF